jgi:hypothetical protein
VIDHAPTEPDERLSHPAPTLGQDAETHKRVGMTSPGPGDQHFVELRMLRHGRCCPWLRRRDVVTRNNPIVQRKEHKAAPFMGTS